MEYEIYICPVCGKYEIDDLDGYECCPECGWEVNKLQYDDHNESLGLNSLSVNDHKLQYEAMCVPELKQRVQALRKEFLKERWDIKELMRDFSQGSAKADFAAAQPMFEQVTNKYVGALKDLLASVQH